MPEGPEVEFAARSLRRWAEGRRVEAVETDPRARRVFRPASPRAFAAGVAGGRVEAVRRAGKHLLLTLSRGGAPVGVLAHLGMTGKWLLVAPGAEAPPHSRARFRLDDGAVLHFRDPRLFGRLRLVPGARFEEVPELAALGPDPIAEGIDPVRLGALLSRSRLPVKVRIMDQAVLPGVGNIYASEALFRARIDPRRPARALAPPEVRRVAKAVVDVLRASVARETGDEIAYVEERGAVNPFRVYARAGERCPRCRDRALVRIVQAGRSTFCCPGCQR
jgi:formamidopyrimidine-DNA glycosylase